MPAHGAVLYPHARDGLRPTRCGEHGWEAGDQSALEAMAPLMYQELRRLAASYVARERPEYTLQATALVHEAYLRLADLRGVG